MSMIYKFRLGTWDFSWPRQSNVCCLLVCFVADRLQLGANRLAGQLPGELASLQSLSFIDVARNEFTGPIPFFLFEMPSLETLDIGSNLFTGSIPSQIDLAASLRDFYVTNNLLSGEIPPEMANATTLSILSLAQNDFTGSIPDFLFQLPLLGTNVALVLVHTERASTRIAMSRLHVLRTVI